MTNFCLYFCIRLKFQNCQISSALDLLMRPAGIVCHWTQTPVSRIHRTSFQCYQILEFRDKRKLMPFREIFSEFNNKLVVAFYDKWRWKLSLTFFFLLWMLKNTFTTFPVSSQVFWCLEHTNNCFIFSESGLKYLKPLQFLLSMNQVNILKDKILTKIQNS